MILLIIRQLLARAQLNAAWLAHREWVNRVRRTGGKIKPHHNAFFMAADGSQMGDAYITSDLRVRFVTEYADVSPNFSSVWPRSTAPTPSRVSPSPPLMLLPNPVQPRKPPPTPPRGPGRTGTTNRILGRNPCFPRQRRQLRQQRQPKHLGPKEGKPERLATNKCKNLKNTATQK